MTQQVTTQIALVFIMQNGGDIGLFVNGALIFSADPSFDEDVATVQNAATNLAKALSVPDIQEIEHYPVGDWTWDNVQAALFPAS